MSECPSNFGSTNIPFFPAPDAAPDSCSCNLGNLYLAVNASETEGATCISSVGETALGNSNSDPITVSDKQAACACCGESGAISACVMTKHQSPAYKHEWETMSMCTNPYDCPATIIFAPIPTHPLSVSIESTAILQG